MTDTDDAGEDSAYLPPGRALHLPALDNRSLGMSGSGTRPRRKAKRRKTSETTYFDDDAAEAEILEPQTNTRKRGPSKLAVPSNVVYVSITPKESELDYSSCDELPDDDDDAAEGDSDHNQAPHLSRHLLAHANMTDEERFIAFMTDDGSNDVQPLPVSNRVPRSAVRRRQTHRDFCFLCDFTDKKAAVASTPVDGTIINVLTQTIDANIGTDGLDIYKLARMVHCIYKTLYWEPALVKPTMWRTSSIYEHILTRMDPKYKILEWYKETEKIKDTIKEKLLYRVVEPGAGDGDPATVTEHIHQQNAKLYLDYQKRLMEICRLNPEAMNFRNPECTVNLANVGRLFNPAKNIRFSKKTVPRLMPSQER